MTDTLQILKATGARPRITFYSGVVASDLDSGVPVVTITRPDGTTIASGTVSHVGAANSGTYEFQLSSASVPNETFLTLAWTGTIGGVSETLTTYVEVLGGLLFTLPELRALKVGDETPFSTTATPLYTDAQLQEARSAVLDEFTQRLELSPVPRFHREVLDGNGRTCLGLTKLKAHRILSVAVNGVAQTASGYRITKGNELQAVANYGYGTAFTWGFGNVAVEYVHGETRVMGEGSVAAMVAVARLLIPGFSSAARTVTTPDGVSYDLGDMAGQVTRGGSTRRFGIPFVDAWLQAWAPPGLGVA